MKTSSFYIVLLFITLGPPPCIAQKHISPGIYEKVADSTSEIEEIILYPDGSQTFEYRLYTAEPDREKYGSGTYRQTNKKLVLRFDERLHPSSPHAPLHIIDKGTVMKFKILDISPSRIELMHDDQEKHFALKEPD